MQDSKSPSKEKEEQNHDMEDEKPGGGGSALNSAKEAFFGLMEPVDDSDPFVRGEKPKAGQGRPSDPEDTYASPGKDEKGQDEESSEGEEDKEEQRGAQHVNLEVAFAYRSLPVKGKKVYSKAKNAHLIVEFGTGLKGIFQGKIRRFSFRIREGRGEH